MNIWYPIMGISSVQQYSDHTATQKHLRKITGALLYFSNQQLHQDLGLETVQEIAAKTTGKYMDRLHDHMNTEAIMLLEDPATQLSLIHISEPTRPY